jgi:hypothetical protein
MGLDMYAYSAAKAGAHAEYWDSVEFVDGNTVAKVEKPKEIAYWRKHPNLHGWMARLWEKRTGGSADDFNGVELELSDEDLNDLEKTVKEGELPGTSGFFFGNNADDYYKEADLEFIAHARADMFCGLRVFYNSSW